MAARKQAEERRVARLVTEDLRDQVRALEEQFNVAQATQIKQEEIEARLKAHYDTASRELDLALQEALKRKAEQA